MAWVPIEESDEQFSFSTYGSDPGAAFIVDSVATQDAGSPPSSGPTARWFIAFDSNGGARSPLRLRFTSQSFEVAYSEFGILPNPVSWGTGTPGAGASTIGTQDNTSLDPGNEWLPSPFEINLTFEDTDPRFVAYYLPSEGDPSTSSFLIEVWVDGPTPPTPITYNCECEDDYPRKTLAQMRRRLLVRLGYSAQADNPPPGMATLLDDFTVQAQELLYRKYAVFRTERFFTWDMVRGARFYDLDDNSDVCTKKLDPRKVTWVGVSLGDDQWQPIACGIDPSLYGTRISGIPERYEIRQCIEVWPAPSDNTWKLRIKGHFGLLPFAADTDYTTIDAEAVFLLALANAKAHYGQPDAGNYVQQLQTYLGDLIAGSHHTRRYLPGERANRLRPVPRVKGE